MVYGGVDLPWEWRDEYRLRSSLYPLFLSLPLRLLKALGLDYGYAVRTCPKLAHIALVIVSDGYLWSIGKQVVGKSPTRIAFYILFFARTYNELMTRTLTNSIETVFQVIAFYYFLQVTNKFDKNLVLLTSLLTMSFMIRGTSPIGWPPLILIKMIKDRSWLPFALAFFFVFIPVAGLAILADSYHYGDFPVLTSLNFMRVNVSEGLSKYFGSDPYHYYLVKAIPFFFILALPAVIFGYYLYLRDRLSSLSKGGQVPYVAILCLTYLLVFTVIAHKEVRFVLPIIPFSALMASYAVAKWAKHAATRPLL